MSVKLADSDAYQSALQQVFAYIERLNEPLQTTVRTFFEPLSKSSMVKMMTLMPHWLTDLVPSRPEHVKMLALAHLYIAWYYHAQDELLDGQTQGNVMLGAHLALLKAAEIYRNLGVLEGALGDEFWRLTELSAESYALETRSHFSQLDELTAERIAPFTTTFIINRLSPIFFNSLAQLHLAGVKPDNPQHGRVLDALRAIYISLQLGDDMSDWLTDLQAGQLNAVSAGLIRHLYGARPGTTAADLTLEGLAGYQLTAADYWGSLEETINGLNKQALSLLADVEPCRLREKLLRPHIEQMNRVWPVYQAQNRRIQELFGL